MKIHKAMSLLLALAVLGNTFSPDVYAEEDIFGKGMEEVSVFPGADGGTADDISVPADAFREEAVSANQADHADTFPVGGYRDLPEEFDFTPGRLDDYAYDAYPRLRSNTAPSSYGYEDFKDYMPPLRDQSPFGSCWAMATMAQAEINLAKNGYADKDEINLSEVHLAYYTYNNTAPDPLGGTVGDINRINDSYNFGYRADEVQINPNDDYLDVGGCTDFAANVLMNWRGAANESDDPYLVYPTGFGNLVTPGEFGQKDLYSSTQLQYNKDRYPELMGYYMASTSDREAVKDLIMRYGSVSLSFMACDSLTGAVDNQIYNGSTNAYYDSNSYDGATNHAVVIVGWDDDFKKEDFATEPSGDGAWLIRNSWSSGSYGANESYTGYFWLSYHNANTANANVFAFDYVPAGTYDNNHQYDGGMATVGDCFKKHDLGDAIEMFNVFTAKTGGEVLDEVSFLVYNSNVSYSVKIYEGPFGQYGVAPADGILLEDATTVGVTEEAGYVRIPLRNPVFLEGGTEFAVVITLEKPGETIYFGVEVGHDNPLSWFSTTVKSDERQSYVRQIGDECFYDNGENITLENGAYVPGNNICIKAYSNDPDAELQLDPNDGSGENVYLPIIYGTEYEYLASNAPARTGYDFAGWYTDPENGVKVEDGDTITIQGDHTLYAHWTPCTYTVTFDPGEGTCSTASKTVTYDATYEVLPVPTRTGYLFQGWFLDGVKITSTTVVSATSDHVLTAEWTVSRYTVTFDVCGGTTPLDDEDELMATKSITYGRTYGRLAITTRRGYNFLGWFTASTGGVQVTSATPVDTEGDRTLYAHWEALQFTLYFNADGGTCATASKTVTYDQAYGELPTPAKTGCTFGGWYTGQRGSGTQILPSMNFSGITDQTVYARWQGNRYTLTFDKNGGNTLNQLRKDVYFNSIYGTLATATKVGYDFAGWFVDGSEITGSTVVTLTGDATAVAHWTPATYLVSFDADGGTCSPATKTVTYDAAYGELPVPERTGHDFVCWKYGDTTVTADTIANLVAGAHALTATWTPKDYEVSFIDELGAVEGTVTVTYGEIYDTSLFPAGGKARLGYTAASYKLGSASGSAVTDTTTVTTASDHTIYIVWQPKQLTVSFDAGETGATCSVTSKTVTYGSAYGDLPEPTPALDRVFTGWVMSDADRDYVIDNCEPGYTVPGSGIDKDTDVWCFRDHTLRAVYADRYYTISFDTNGGDGDPEAITRRYNDRYGTLPVTTRTGYTFTGWVPDEPGAVKIGETSKFYYRKDITLVAKWAPAVFTITFDAGSGTAAYATKTVEYGKTFGSLPSAYKQGNTLDGWFTGDGTQVTSETTVTILSNTTLYARYSPAAYTYTLDYNGGTQGVLTITGTYGDVFGELPETARDGYDHTGWYIGNTRITSETVVWATGNVTITARWSGKMSSLSFDGYTYDAVAVKFGEAVPDLPVPARTGYEFTGWEDTDGVVITAGTVCSWTENRTLHARFSVKSYKITFDANGGSCDTAFVMVSYGDAYGALPVAARKGYTADGWYTEDGGKVTAETVMDKASDHKLVMRWTKDPDPVTPDPEPEPEPDPKPDPDPVTPDPVTPDPVTPDPEPEPTPDPVTPDPVTPDPEPEPEPEPDPYIHDEDAHVTTSQSYTSSTGKVYTAQVETDYDDDLEYKGVVIKKADLDITCGLALSDEERSYTDCIKIDKYVIKNATEAYVHGEPGYNAKKRPYFYVVLKVDSKKAKAQDIKGKNLEALKKLVSKLNKELKTNKNYFDILPAKIQDTVIDVTSKASSKKTTYTYTTGNMKVEVTVDKKGAIKVSSVKFKKSNGKWLKLKKDKTFTQAIDNTARTVTITGKKNLSGSMTITIP